MALAGVQIMAMGQSEPMAELRLQGGRAVAVVGGTRAGVADMLEFGIDFRSGDAALVSRFARRYGVRVPRLKKGERRTVTADDGELFLLAVLSRYARPTGYSSARAVRG